MAEHELRARSKPASRRDARADTGGSGRHEALEARGAAREERQADLLNKRVAQRRAEAGKTYTSRPQPLVDGPAPSEAEPVQLAMKVGNRNKLDGAGGTAYWHYTFNDQDQNSLHLTLGDNDSYNNRTWASRRSYTPTSQSDGDWSDWANNHGQTPKWATDLAKNKGLNDAVAAFHADANVKNLLKTAFPQAAVNLASNVDFPPLG